MASDWTVERVNLLEELWAAGYSARVIADKIGNCSRNAVIGRANRMGLARRAKTPKRGRTTESSVPKIKKARQACGACRPQRSSFRPPPKPKSPPITDGEIPQSQRRAFMELEKRHCRYPIGEPKTPGFFFCGAAKKEGSSYCAGHHERCYADERVHKPFILDAWRAARVAA